METAAFTEAVVSHAAASGYFDRVNKHEPKNAPGDGLTAAVWFVGLVPLPNASGLVSTSVRLAMNLRIYSGMVQEPQDGIDDAVLQAVDWLMQAYSSDFSLDGLIRQVDLLGEFGVPLEAQSGYLAIDQKMMRIVDITVPLIINDAFLQVA